MWAAKWAEQLVERGCGQLNGQNSLWRELWAAKWAEQLVERGCGQLNGQNSLWREDVGS